MPRKEKSCGAVVFTRNGGGISYLLIRSLNGNYGFPKGHVEPGESERQTALREILEETGLSVSLIRGFRKESRYQLYDGARKTVVFFLGEATDTSLTIQTEEVVSAGFFPFGNALALLVYENDKGILREADAFLNAGAK